MYPDGQTLTQLRDYTPEGAAEQLRNSDTNAWYYHDRLRITFIKVFDDQPKRKIVLKYR